MPLEFGCVVIISGKSSVNANNFIIRFCSEKNFNELPFNINVIFGKYQQILRNSKINGMFGADENSPSMLTKEMNPLKSGKH
jgi:hypothetical protein